MKKKHLLILILPFIFSPLLYAKVTPTEEDAYEKVIRYHFNVSGSTNQLMGRLGLEGKDPSNSFINRFSDYNGYFLKISQLSTAEAAGNIYYFVITFSRYESRNKMVIYACDGEGSVNNHFEFIVERSSPSQPWYVTSAHILEDVL